MVFFLRVPRFVVSCETGLKPGAGSVAGIYNKPGRSAFGTFPGLFIIFALEINCQSQAEESIRFRYAKEFFMELDR